MATCTLPPDSARTPTTRAWALVDRGMWTELGLLTSTGDRLEAHPAAAALPSSEARLPVRVCDVTPRVLDDRGNSPCSGGRPVSRSRTSGLSATSSTPRPGWQSRAGPFTRWSVQAAAWRQHACTASLDCSLRHDGFCGRTRPANRGRGQRCPRGRPTASAPCGRRVTPWLGGGDRHRLVAAGRWAWRTSTR